MNRTQMDDVSSQYYTNWNVIGSRALRRTDFRLRIRSTRRSWVCPLTDEDCSNVSLSYIGGDTFIPRALESVSQPGPLVERNDEPQHSPTNAAEKIMHKSATNRSAPTRLDSTVWGLLNDRPKHFLVENGNWLGNYCYNILIFNLFMFIIGDDRNYCLSYCSITSGSSKIIALCIISLFRL